MLHDVFGELTFNVGWKASLNMKLFGENHPIILKLQAYYKEDGITKEQEEAYVKYKDDRDNKLETIEKLLLKYADSPEKRFIPKTLLFERDGSYALLCSDNDEPDEGIAVCLAPKEVVMSQDEYL